ncbi:membrane protein [Blastomonas marina]|uniref:Membrane protein n=1 Tax=Blastomonas marina TaxID=1867408 RepID=A0ABQ1FCY9_9SPHN|nr:DMT family transporter [Blastomonas marina]GGA06558.1 membrane protein [Blastomonas marina]
MQHDERTGLLLALLGFSVLSAGDAVVKTMAGDWSPAAVAALRYTIGTVGLGVLLWWREGRKGFAYPRPGVQLMRGLGVGGATLGFFSAVFVMPLATATAIVFLSPIITAILAIMFLGEPSRRATWVAAIAGFIGVLVLLRPGFSDLGWAAALPLVSAFGVSLMMLGNRMSANLASPLAMQFSIASIAAVFLVLAAAIGAYSGVEALAVGSPDWTVVARCAIVALTATTAHWLVFLGTTRAGAATIAPTTYVQMIVAVLLGMVLFGDVPDALTLLGAVIIIGAGLYLWRETGRAPPQVRE